MVVLLSPAALTSAFVQREIEYALGDERFKGRLVPVVVRSVKEIPWILEKLDVLRIEYCHPAMPMEDAWRELTPWRPFTCCRRRPYSRSNDAPSRCVDSGGRRDRTI
jgi:hypothetical protein